MLKLRTSVHQKKSLREKITSKELISHLYKWLLQTSQNNKDNPFFKMSKRLEQALPQRGHPAVRCTHGAVPSAIRSTAAHAGIRKDNTRHRRAQGPMGLSECKWVQSAGKTDWHTLILSKEKHTWTNSHTRECCGSIPGRAPNWKPPVSHPQLNARTVACSC